MNRQRLRVAQALDSGALTADDECRADAECGLSALQMRGDREHNGDQSFRRCKLLLLVRSGMSASTGASRGAGASKGVPIVGDIIGELEE